jgi:beta-lactamase class A
VRPTRQPLPLSTPQGTTGVLSATPGPVDLDNACLDTVDGRATPVPGDVRIKPTTETIELPDPYSPVPGTEDRTLQRQLVEILGDKADRYAFVVKDLRTGRTATHNAEMVFNSASLFKLWIMFEAFLQHDQRLLDWRTEYVVTRYFDDFALSPRVTELCQKLTVADAMEAMLSVSDNAAAVMLQDIVGAGNINNALAAFGVLNSGLYSDGLPLTAADVALLLEAIGRGQAVSSAASSDMLNLMSREVIDNGLTEGLPKGVPVAHKTGNWSDATHDAGIVFAANGPYVFVALSATSYETEKIKAMSEAVYRYFGNR